MLSLPARRWSGLRSRLAMTIAALALAAFAPFGAASAQAAGGPVRIALLATLMQNDHAEWVPTTDAERARLARLGETFRTMLEGSGGYRFADIDPAMRSRIDQDQKPGECGGCEVRYGKELGVSQVAWIEVQKVSELILNVNVYISDVNTGERIFVKSVDMRGNTDETWNHAMKYLVRHYLLTPPKS